ncbi:hypothetical protein QAD02_011510 [Eretmocerus hayati]|uniref:Uncharacterized protein n=1 Tax=Eretmocerus hayati TaxID=131215 RepID=A0ACC2NZK4_9HYME|nr:hypothetical protein QAD02_011510 [Eretmocerus hayati]
MEGPPEKRQKYSDGIAMNDFKDSGVKKLFILALAPCTQESYTNLKLLWDALNINSCEGTIATDLKLANLLGGLMQYSSKYPCTWCDACKENLRVWGNPRTIKNVRDNYKKWTESGSKKSERMKYKNCVHLPLFTGPDDRPYLEIIPPPELHFMLDVGSTVYSHMLKEFETDALTRAASCNVQREITHGGPEFKRNSCKKLLKRVDSLRANCDKNCLKYGLAFEDFQKCVLSHGIIPKVPILVH